MSDVADDRAARKAALDPEQSFIVQAPAGSGKTELLIQRYLVLLAHVDEPEQIVAITFTRKAAGEMRNRVLDALRAAAEGRAAAQPHQEHTLQLASAALRRGEARDWSLLAQPRRIRIETLDALNARLARQLPAMSGGVASARVIEDAGDQYRLAAQRTVGELTRRDALGSAIRVLLQCLDNSVLRLEALLAGMLPKREQWLRHLAGTEKALRASLEHALQRLVAEQLEAAGDALPDTLRVELPPLLRHAALRASSAEVRAVFCAWEHEPASQVSAGASRGLNSSEALEFDSSEPRELDSSPQGFDSIQGWQAVAHLLLTQQDEWRQRLDRKLGFGPDHPERRRELQAVLETAAEAEPLRAALAAVRRLPAPRYSDEQWRSMVALGVVLRQLAAELRVVFAEQQAVDFVELAMAAQQALGRSDSPSELLLALDRRIQHLLVDEFQDTSHSQFRLLELLTSGWEPGDGRSLFLVGDPMQSIYRFRDADMSLFLRVRQQGLGAIHCRALTLHSNFRSAPAVVQWINMTFARAFPTVDDIVSGAARFSSSVAAREAVQGAEVHAHALRSAQGDDELAAAISIIESEQIRRPQQTIAVLVQSRTHLQGLHQQLRARGLQVNAVDIDPLNEHQVVQDLMGLTRALTHLADRTAWLAVLRAPWCGLTWRDLDALCGADRGRTLWELLHDEAALGRMGDDGRARASWLQAMLTTAFEERGSLPFERWVERTWLALRGIECCESPEDLHYAERFFAILAELVVHGDLDEPGNLEAAFSSPQGPAAPARDAGVEIMTIHRAKGLEFDVVILFGLGREPRREDARALYWLERAAADGSDDLIMSPLTAPGADDRLTAFLRRADEAREVAERGRLLYVAATRARERLHLVCRLDPETETPSPRTLLSLLWADVEQRFAAETKPAPAPQDPEWIRPVLRRLAGGFSMSTGTAPVPRADIAGSVDIAGSRIVAGGGIVARSEVVAAYGIVARSGPIDEAEAEPRPEFDWARQPAIHIGTLVHRYLQRMTAGGIEQWDAERVRSLDRTFQRELMLLGLEASEAAPAAARVAKALIGTLGDPVGRWILSAHEDARSELRLTLRDGDALRHLWLDRTFVDDKGIRWIVDFKTGTHEGGHLDAFLDAEVERYRPQLERYAAAMSDLEVRPIRTGLYFPLLQAFRSWTPFDSVDRDRSASQARPGFFPLR